MNIRHRMLSAAAGVSSTPAGIKAFWKFENNANDETGTYNGTATNVTYVAGKYSIAASFVVANNSKIVTPNIAIGSTSFSYSVWVYRTIPVGTYTTICEFSTSPYGTMQITSGDLLYYYDTASRFFSPSTAGAVPLNVWTHIVYSISGSTVTLYINGVLWGTAACGNTSPNSVFNIGRAGNNAYSWGGLIDQFRIYPYALTQAQVTALYNEV